MTSSGVELKCACSVLCRKGDKCKGKCIFFHGECPLLGVTMTDGTQSWSISECRHHEAMHRKADEEICVAVAIIASVGRDPYVIARMSESEFDCCLMVDLIRKKIRLPTDTISAQEIYEKCLEETRGAINPSMLQTIEPIVVGTTLTIVCSLLDQSEAALSSVMGDFAKATTDLPLTWDSGEIGLALVPVVDLKKKAAAIEEIPLNLFVKVSQHMGNLVWLLHERATKGLFDTLHDRYDQEMNCRLPSSTPSSTPELASTPCRETTPGLVRIPLLHNKASGYISAYTVGTIAHKLSRDTVEPQHRFGFRLHFIRHYFHVALAGHRPFFCCMMYAAYEGFLSDLAARGPFRSDDLKSVPLPTGLFEQIKELKSLRDNTLHPSRAKECTCVGSLMFCPLRDIALEDCLMTTHTLVVKMAKCVLLFQRERDLRMRIQNEEAASMRGICVEAGMELSSTSMEEHFKESVMNAPWSVIVKEEYEGWNKIKAAMHCEKNKLIPPIRKCCNEESKARMIIENKSAADMEKYMGSHKKKILSLVPSIVHWWDVGVCAHVGTLEEQYAQDKTIWDLKTKEPPYRCAEIFRRFSACEAVVDCIVGVESSLNKFLDFENVPFKCNWATTREHDPPLLAKSPKAMALLYAVVSVVRNVLAHGTVNMTKGSKYELMIKASEVEGIRDDVDFETAQWMFGDNLGGNQGYIRRLIACTKLKNTIPFEMRLTSDDARFLLRIVDEILTVVRHFKTRGVRRSAETRVPCEPSL